MNTGKSFIKIDIDSHEVTASYRQLSRVFSASKRAEFNQVGAIAANDEIQQYYLKAGRQLWINPALPTHGPGRQQSAFAKRITDGWAVTQVNGSGASIGNSAIGLAHKVTGGTIKAKRKKFLTIPIIPQAHARRASDFVADIGPLFAAKGCLMWKRPDGSIIPAYALKKSVTHKPWKGALPPDVTIADAFADAATGALMDELTKPE